MEVGIAGGGVVGATSAYAIMMRKTANDIVLIDANPKRAAAEAEDILHAAPFVYATDVYAGSCEDLTDAEIVVIASGASQKPGESRLMLMQQNASF